MPVPGPTMMIGVSPLALQFRDLLSGLGNEPH